MPVLGQSFAPALTTSAPYTFGCEWSSFSQTVRPLFRRISLTFRPSVCATAFTHRADTAKSDRMTVFLIVFSLFGGKVTKK